MDLPLPGLYKMDSVQTDYACPICLLTLTNPILLTGCGHNVCEECLQDIFQQQGSQRIKCPQCRVKTETPNGMQSLPKNLSLQTALDKLQNLKQLDSQLKRSENQCPDHKQNFEFICLEHNELCCIICSQFGDHSGHQVKDIKSAKEELNEQLQKLYQEAQNKKAQSEKCLERYGQLKIEAQQKHQDFLKEIDESFKSLISKIILNKETILNGAQQKFQDLDQQIQATQEKIRPLVMDIHIEQDIFQLAFYKEKLESIQNIKLPNPEDLEIQLNAKLKFDEKAINELGGIKVLRVGPGKLFFRFDEVKKGSNIQIFDAGYRFGKISGGEFQTVLGSEELIPGKIYQWFIKVLHGSSFKIGVSQAYTQYGNAFSDFETGWAWYTSDRQLRHHSNSSGEAYGDSIAVGDIIGVILDTIEGTLSYSKNGRNLGVAYNNPIFKTQPLFPAFSCLNNNESLELVTESGEKFEKEVVMTSSSSFFFTWDASKSYSSAVIRNENRICEFQLTSGYRTIMGTTALQPQKIYKWKLKLVARTDYKIGVSKMITTFDSAFSDYETGWAFFNREAQLRHNSGSGGSEYGVILAEGGIIEVICDTISGNLSFVLNGQSYGNAYSGIVQLCDGNLYPAVACLDSGGIIEILEASVSAA